MTLQQLIKEYAPYDRLNAFKIGFIDHELGFHDCPWGEDSVARQAWDRGHEAAMRAERLGLSD